MIENKAVKSVGNVHADLWVGDTIEINDHRYRVDMLFDAKHGLVLHATKFSKLDTPMKDVLKFDLREALKQS